MIHIEQITPELTWRLRRDVLYPNAEIPDMEMDVDRGGTHFGAFAGNKLAGVISLFREGDDFQFRKFAVDADFQNKGIGTALLNYITEFSVEDGGLKLWCNARLNAIGFYLKNGFIQTDRLFSKNGYDYVIMEKPLISTSGN
jgi:GNAT superfamily N-acetyltransferase